MRLNIVLSFIFSLQSSIVLGFQKIQLCKRISSILYDSNTAGSDLHNNLFHKVNQELGLKLTDFTEVYKGQNWKEGEWSGTAGIY